MTSDDKSLDDKPSLAARKYSKDMDVSDDLKRSLEINYEIEEVFSGKQKNLLQDSGLENLIETEKVPKLTQSKGEARTSYRHPTSVQFHTKGAFERERSNKTTASATGSRPVIRSLDSSWIASASSPIVAQEGISQSWGMTSTVEKSASMAPKPDGNLSGMERAVRDSGSRPSGSVSLSWSTLKKPPLVRSETQDELIRKQLQKEQWVGTSSSKKPSKSNKVMPIQANETGGVGLKSGNGSRRQRKFSTNNAGTAVRGPNGEHVKVYDSHGSLQDEDDDPLAKMKFTREVPSCFLLPTSKFMSFWDPVMVVLLAYTAVVTPFQISFVVESGSMTHPMFWIDRVVDLAFLVDIMINFRLGYVNEEGMIETSGRRVARRYAKTWFLVDLISILPLDIILESLDVGTSSQVARVPKLLRIFRLFKLIKIARVFRMTRIMRRWETRFEVKYGHLTMIKFFFLIALLSHWNACVFFLIHSVEQDVGQDDEIITVAKVRPPPAPSPPLMYSAAQPEPQATDTITLLSSENETATWAQVYGLDDADYFSQYIASLYWAVMTVTTIGYGDITPNTTAERVFAIIAMITGGGIFAYVLGTLSSLVQGLDGGNVAFRKTMDDLNLYMNYRKLPKDLRQRVRQFYYHCRMRPEFVKEAEMLAGMSKQLRTQVLAHCYGSVIKNVPVFGGADDSFVADVALRLHQQTFGPMEYIVRSGEKPSALYIIQSGTVQVLGQGNERKVISILKEGALIGEAGILFRKRQHDDSAKTITFVDTVYLNKRDLANVLLKYPQIREKVRRLAVRKLWNRALASVKLYNRLRILRGPFGDTQEKAIKEAQKISIVEPHDAEESVVKPSSEEREGGEEQDTLGELTGPGHYTPPPSPLLKQDSRSILRSQKLVIDSRLASNSDSDDEDEEDEGEAEGVTGNDGSGQMESVPLSLLTSAEASKSDVTVSNAEGSGARKVDKLRDRRKHRGGSMPSILKIDGYSRERDERLEVQRMLGISPSQDCFAGDLSNDDEASVEGQFHGNRRPGFLRASSHMSLGMEHNRTLGMEIRESEVQRDMQRNIAEIDTFSRRSLDPTDQGTLAEFREEVSGRLDRLEASMTTMKTSLDMIVAALRKS